MALTVSFQQVVHSIQYPYFWVSGLRKPVEIAQELADEVMNDLDKLNRFLGRNSDGRRSLEAHALLLSELWDAFPSEEMDHLKSWAKDLVDRGDWCRLNM